MSLAAAHSSINVLIQATIVASVLAAAAATSSVADPRVADDPSAASAGRRLVELSPWDTVLGRGLCFRERVEAVVGATVLARAVVHPHRRSMMNMPMTRIVTSPMASKS